jgi:hypothetical protein
MSPGAPGVEQVVEPPGYTWSNDNPNAKASTDQIVRQSGLGASAVSIMCLSVRWTPIPRGMRAFNPPPSPPINRS